ncbi:MAG TPA: metallophosphoesterase [Actinocrinis sp.]|nr:metallophosphoesterase [Actinocrinis sp.]
MPGSLFAVSDLHVGYEQNRSFVESLEPESDQDWLIVAGDVAERFEHVAWALGTLRPRFAKVVWAPGNHELWTMKDDPVQARGAERYQVLVELCRKLDILTPEDPYAVWEGEGGPVALAPLFLLYDYSFHPPGTSTKEEGLAVAYGTGVVCTDESVLYPDPYPSREAWCDARITYTEKRLQERPDGLPTVLINHFPLTRTPTAILRYPEFAQWCGTVRTADWHTRFDARTVVYGHLHIPRTTFENGVRFEEVSLGYPREWQPRGGPGGLRRIMPPAQDEGGFRFKTRGASA